MEFFPGGEGDLFGVTHLPEMPLNDVGYVFCHPLAEEKLWSHRVFVNFARELAAGGSVALRFDHFGHGDSDGDFSRVSVDSMLNEIHHAKKHMIDKCSWVKRVVFLGLRMGANNALGAARRYGADAVVAWEPITDGGRYSQEILRTNIAAQMATFGEVRKNREALVEDLRSGKHVNVEGYEITLPLYVGIESISLAESITALGDTPLLIVNVNRSEKGTTSAYEKVVSESLNADGIHRVDLRIAKEEPFWREIRSFYQRADDLYRQTQSWLDELVD